MRGRAGGWIQLRMCFRNVTAITVLQSLHGTQVNFAFLMVPRSPLPRGRVCVCVCVCARARDIRWVQAQLRILFGAVGRLGHADQDSWSVSFGTLFLAYQDISDAVGRGRSKSESEGGGERGPDALRT